MTRDEIIELVTAFEYVWDLAKSHGVDPVYQDLHGFEFEDLILATELYGGIIRDVGSDENPLFMVDLGKVALVS